MKTKFTTGLLFISFIFVTNNVFTQNLQLIQERKLIFEPFISFKFFNPYDRLPYVNITKGIVTIAPQVGIDIQFQNSRSGFSLRKEWFYALFMDDNFTDIKFKSEGWIIEYKYKISKCWKIKELQLGSGFYVFDIQNIAEHLFGSNYPTYGAVFFASLPFKYLRVELRLDCEISPILQFSPYSPVSVCLIYNFKSK